MSLFHHGRIPLPRFVTLAALSLAIAACGADDVADSSAVEGEADSDEIVEAAAEADESENDGEAEGDVIFTSGTSSGTWLPVAGLMSEIVEREAPGVRVTVTEGGGAVNPQRVNAGSDAQIGFSYTNEFFAGKSGEGDYADEPLDALQAMFFTSVTQYGILVREDSDIYTIEDLVGARIAASNPGEGAELLTGRVLEIHGLSYEDVEAAGGSIVHTGTSEMAGLMRDGLVDAVTVMGPARQSVGIELESWRPIRAINIDEDKIEEFRSQWPGYIMVDLPAGTYEGHDETINTIGSPVIMIAHEDVSDEIAYAITKNIVENGEQINEPYTDYDIGTHTAAIAIDNAEFYHPGALRYLEEQGLIESGS